MFIEMITPKKRKAPAERDVSNKYIAPDGARICYLIVFYKHFTPIGVGKFLMLIYIRHKAIRHYIWLNFAISGFLIGMVHN